MKEGDFLGLRGPFGRGFTPSENGLLIGGGIGIAPLRFLAHLLKREKMKPELLFGVNSSSDLIFNAHYQGSPRCTLVSRDDSFPNQGFVTDFIEEIVEKRKIAKIFSAGPEGMLIKVREIAIRSGIPYELSLERYMKCGLGICGQCCLDGSGLRLCVEGPVLAEKEISQITELGKPHRKASGKRASTPRNF
ncbi:dihydroorotate dehydrogenase electron transfer subunit [bacterium]|nr:dihydroorotate dehydrogenase electron transfer subunit [bacterium]